MTNPTEEEKIGFGQKLSNGCSSFGKFLYNSETGMVMGRSGQSWAKIGLFYLVFYGFLAGFFSAMLAVFMTTINNPNDGGPKLTQYIKNQAGVTRIGDKNLLKGHKADDTNAALAYTNAINKFFEAYDDTDVYKGGECNVNNTSGVPAGSPACYAPKSLLGPCSPDFDPVNKTDYGFSDKKPCVFLKINRVYDWVPTGSGQYLTVDCAGKSKDAVIGQHPEGFLLAAFPFRGVKGHQLPVVAVQIDAVKAGSSGQVDCKLTGVDIEISGSFNPARSFGKIRIEDVYFQ